MEERCLLCILKNILNLSRNNFSNASVVWIIFCTVLSRDLCSFTLVGKKLFSPMRHGRLNSSGTCGKGGASLGVARSSTPHSLVQAQSVSEAQNEFCLRRFEDITKPGINPFQLLTCCLGAASQKGSFLPPTHPWRGWGWGWRGGCCRCSWRGPRKPLSSSAGRVCFSDPSFWLVRTEAPFHKLINPMLKKVTP